MFSLAFGLTIPISVIRALFANGLVDVLRGPTWKGSLESVRRLAPTVAIFAASGNKTIHTAAPARCAAELLPYQEAAAGRVG